MKLPRSLSLILPILALILLGQGCAGTTATSNAADGGVYKTADHGVTWVQKRILIKGAKAVTLGNDPITAITIDPEDSQAVYAGTAERGIVASLDGGDSWQEVIKGPVGKIQSIIVDPKNKCVVYASIANKIYKTENCTRDFTQIFFDPKTTKIFTQLAIDWFNSTILYAGTSEGEIFKSTDGGLSWQVVERTNASVTSILIDDRDSRTVYVGTYGDGVWKTMDGGSTWIQIKKQLQNFSGAARVAGLELDHAEHSTLYLISKFGLLASTSTGDTWSSIPLTSQTGSVDLIGIKVNPRNEKEITYITKNTMFFTTDQGATWITKKLPSSRPATALTMDRQDGKTVYIGFGAVPQQ
ncbi:MAG: hypothetical protein WC477_03325 [Patescibacteria group bacterium]